MASNDIVVYALRSQEMLKQNAFGTMTFVDVAKKLMEELNTPLPQIRDNIPNKNIINSYGKLVKQRCIDIYKDQFRQIIKNEKN